MRERFFALEDKAAVEAALFAFDYLHPVVPVDTGTLQAAQGIEAEEGHGIARILTRSGFLNPVSDTFAHDYVGKVVTRNDFYNVGAGNIPTSRMSAHLADFAADFLGGSA